MAAGVVQAVQHRRRTQFRFSIVVNFAATVEGLKGLEVLVRFEVPKL